MMEDSILRHKYKNRFLKNLTNLLNNRIATYLGDGLSFLKGVSQTFVDYVQIPYNREAMTQKLCDLYIDDYVRIPCSKGEHYKEVQRNKIRHNRSVISKLLKLNNENINRLLNQTLQDALTDYRNSSEFTEHLSEITNTFRMSKNGSEYIHKFEKISREFISYFASEGVANEMKNERKTRKFRIMH